MKIHCQTVWQVDINTDILHFLGDLVTSSDGTIRFLFFSVANTQIMPVYYTLNHKQFLLTEIFSEVSIFEVE